MNDEIIEILSKQDKVTIQIEPEHMARILLECSRHGKMLHEIKDELTAIYLDDDLLDTFVRTVFSVMDILLGNENGQ